MPVDGEGMDLLGVAVAGRVAGSRRSGLVYGRHLPDVSAAAVALISIRPKYVELIRGGMKRVEFRRRPFARDVACVVIYAAAPVKKLVGFCEVEGAVLDTPAALWARYGPAAGLSREALFLYLNGVDFGFAIELGPFRPFADGLALSALGIDRPPQSFRYLPVSALADLVGWGASLP